jgi:hypothetical protein
MKIFARKFPDGSITQRLVAQLPIFTYRQIVESLSPQSLILLVSQLLMSLVPQPATQIRETVSPTSRIVETPSPQLIRRLSLKGLGHPPQ